MAYIGKQPVVGNFVKLDAIVTSATATYNLLNGGVAYYPQTANNCIVSLNGVIQSPTSAYTISGSTIVFDSALTSSDTIDFILVLGDVLAIGTPSDATVTNAKLALTAGSAGTPTISPAADTNTGIFFPAADTIGFAEGGTEAMRIDSSGDVGIGTTASFTSGNGLEIQRAGVATLRCDNSTASSAGEFRADATGTAIDCRGLEVFRVLTGGSERMRIDSTGNVSIGTTDQGYKLGIISSSTATPPLAIRSTAASDAGTALLRIMKFTNTNTTSQIFMQFVIDANNTNSGQINANGASQAAFGSFSDIRLKKNIENLPNQLNNILNLRPVEFDFKDDSGHQIGFIAQEMEQVYPDVVGVGQDEMLTITGWSKTEARLVKAIQEQQAIIEQLKARLTALES
jgi:hypothetical protein